MTEFEKVVVQDLVNNGTLPFYTRYVDDTLVLIQPDNIDLVLNAFNKFMPGIVFTRDVFNDGNIHFLDITINGTNLETSVYNKPTNTGQYINYDSFTPWRLKISWITSIYERGKRLCSNESSFNSHLLNLRKTLSWNGFPRRVRNAILNRLTNKQPRTQENVPEDDNRKTIWIRLPYMGKNGERLTNQLLRKLKRCFKSAVNFKVLFDTRKISSFCSNNM